MVRKKMESRVEALEQGLCDTEARLSTAMQQMEERLMAAMGNLAKTTKAAKKGTTTGEEESDDDDVVVVKSGNNQWKGVRKVELPLFKGDDAPGWIGKMERYFRFRRVSEEDKIDTVLMEMEEKALSWMQWWESCTENPNWEDFKDAMLRRFQPTVVENAFEILLGLKQETTVREYREQFEVLSGHLKIPRPEYVCGIFANGLKEEIKAEVRLHRPKDLKDMMELALLAEEKIGIHNNTSTSSQNRETLKNTGSFRPWKTDSVGRTTVSSTNTATTATTNIEAKTNRGTKFRSIPSDEYNDRRKKGLCFSCDEKYSPTHVCKKTLKIMVVEDDDPEGVTEGDEEEIVWEGQFKSLNLLSLAGLTTKRSFMMWGNLKEQQVLVLVDNGASHNFVSQKLVKQRNLIVESTMPYWVNIGNGQRIQTRGVCRQVPVTLQGVEFLIDFYVFPLDGEDMVLGMEWLEGLGDIKANFKELTLTIKREGVRYTLKGDPTLSKGEVTAKELVSELQSTTEAFVVECMLLQASTADGKTIPPFIDAVLDSFGEVFTSTEGLPPPRQHDHAIILKEGANIPNLRPYRYPHF